jgi:exosome complex component RRP41
MGKKSEGKLIVKGKRLDGRLPEDLRPVEMKLDIVSRANGSAHVSFGNTVVVTSVFGPKEIFPKHLQEPDTGILKCRYNMAPFSVDDRKRPGPGRRSIEISKVTRLALEPAIFLEGFPNAGIEVYTEVLQADGSTRIAGINSASLALADAGIPMRDLVTACSVGKIDGVIVADIAGDEDKTGEADVAFAMMPNKGLVTLLQMDGILTKEEFKKVLKLAESCCKKIYQKQKNVLKEKYKKVD